MRENRIPIIAIFAAILLAAVPALFTLVSGVLVKWLWMGELGLEVIFFRTLILQASSFAVVFAVVFLFSWANIDAAFRLSPRHEHLHVVKPGEGSMSIPHMRLFALGLCLVFAVLFAFVVANRWETLLGFIWGVPAGQIDPVYGKDLGFYFFRLPFYTLVQGGLTALVFVTSAAVAILYLSLDKVPMTPGGMKVMDSRVLAHLCLLGVALMIALSAGYLLDRYGLFFSRKGVVQGIGYTEYHVTRASLAIMSLASLALAAAFLAAIRVRSAVFLASSAGAFILLAFVSLGLVPGFVQRFVVGPNELGLEEPFLRNSIAFTRRAYLLDRITERAYSARDDLTAAGVAANSDTIRNIRLWDWRPILQTFGQTQAIRLYYQFYEVDVDRYLIPGQGERQVMLSARELAGELPSSARTWVNQTLQFTHGYGLAMSTVSESVGEGLPRYIIDSIPPVSPFLPVSLPAVYYGEKTPGYRIVNTGIKELDFPSGDGNVYTRYQGSGGIPLTSFWKKLLFAWDLRDINILISRYLTPASRIQIWRDVAGRVRRAAPFLVLDRDPYLVLANGRLYWIQDAYTASTRYPYAEPYDRAGRNYLRNSVKAVVDAYNGTVTLYVFDRDDPLIRTYQRAFPGVFRDAGLMPAPLKEHIRYPEDLFTVQVDKYRTYHMTVPQVFYNREDLWAFPLESYGDELERMQPYYVLVRLPGESRLQYIQMIPLTPQNRSNMIAWMASRSDMPGYGEVIVYKLPKERIFYGPVQINAMINQDTLISQQLSLWDQRGSRVIRGNLLVIPIDHSFLYVEPVYLIAEGTNIPQLKRVILSYAGRVVMAPTMGEAVNALFGAQGPRALASPQQGVQPPPRAELPAEIREAENALRQGNWTAFGRAMDRLKVSLGQPQGASPAPEKPGAGRTGP